MLCQSDEPVTVEQLAKMFHVSPRTIRYDLEDIAAWAKEQGGDLEMRPRVGVQLRLPSLPDFGVSTYQFPLSPEQRRYLIAVALLVEPGVSTRDLASWLNASASTIRSDISAVEKLLADEGLNLSWTRAQGFRVSGPEQAWRHAIARFISLLDGEQPVASTLAALHKGRVRDGAGKTLRGPDAGGRRLDPSVCEQLCHLFGAETVQTVAQAVAALEQEADVTFTDEGFTFLVVHLVIALSRLQQGHVPSLPASRVAEVKNLPTYGLAQHLASHLSEQMRLSMPEAEVCYIALHLLGAKEYVALDRLTDPLLTLSADDRSVTVSRAMIGIVENALGCSLAGDSQLLRALVSHVRPLLNRLRFGIQVTNPLLADVKQSYPDIYRACSVASALLAREAGVPALTSDEVGFLTLHFAASLERLQGRPMGPRALVICGSGIGTVRLLVSRLESRFPQLNIAGIGSVLDLETLSQRVRPDVIISTVPLGKQFIPVIETSPLLSPQDVKRIEEWLNERQRQQISTGERPAALHSDETAPASPASAMDGAHGLRALLPAHNIRVGVHAADWVQAIWLATEPLVEAGDVDAGYAEAIVELFRNRGPYQVVAPGLALLHAAPGRHVRRTAFGLTLLKEGVCFGAEERDPVKILFVLASADAGAHLEALRELGQLLVSGTLLDRLHGARSVEEVLRCLPG